MSKETSLNKAISEFDDIKNYAMEQTKLQLEKEVNKKIISLLNEIEVASEVIAEDVKIETDEVAVTIDGQNVSVDSKGNSGTSVADMSSEEGFGDETPTEDEESYEVEPEEETIEISEDMNIQEEDGVAPMATGTPQAAAPAPVAAAPAAEESPEDKIIAGIQALIAQQTSGDTEEGEVDIVDDEQGAPMAGATAPAGPDMGGVPQSAPAQVAEDEDILEIVDDLNQPEEDLFEIELEEDLDEMKMHGVSNSVQRTAGQSAGPKVAVDNRSRQYHNESVNKDKAQHEAKFAELIKENKSLKTQNDEQKSELKKFRESFIDLRNQFNEMQTFNGKLSLMTRLLMNSGFSESDKIKIAERFEKTKSMDEAEKVYKSIVSENKLDVKKVVAESTKIHTTNNAQPQNSTHKVLYESAEIKRMKQLMNHGASEE